MLHSLLSALVLMSVAAAPAMGPPAEWEAVFERGQADKWIGAVYAFGRDEWLVAGSWGVTRSTRGRIERRESPGHGVHGLVEGAPGAVFAVGEGELVFRFDGHTWNEEHLGPVPHGRQQSADALLYSMFQLGGESGAVAFGPRLVLVRATDGSWTEPSKAEGARLMEVAQGGPPQAWRAANCERYAWFWTGRDHGWGACRDARTFAFAGNAIQETGRKPSKCPIIVSVSSGGGETYVACSNETLWRADSGGWRPIDRPPGAKEIVAVASTAECLFVATSVKLWRRCDQTGNAR